MDLSVEMHTYSHYLHQIVSHVFIELCVIHILSILWRGSEMYILVKIGCSKAKP